MGYDRSEDENSVRVLKAVTVNCDLQTEDILEETIVRHTSVFGAADSLLEDISRVPPQGTLVAAGSSILALEKAGIVPDILVTDLDGDIDAQLKASSLGAVAVIHAHGDNADLIQRYASRFKGPVILTTQSAPEITVCNFGGFTDGDRAVCLARHFGAKKIDLYGFDFDHPSNKVDSDADVKRRKLSWAKRIIFDMNPPDVEITMI